MVGVFMAAEQGSHSTCQELATRLEEIHWQTIRTSSKRSRPLRLLDMLTTTWQKRKQYQVAYVEVYSGLSFIWSEAVAWVLKKAHKPFVLALHGGGLALFGQKHPQRMRALLSKANGVVTPSVYLQQKFTPIRADIDHIPNPISLSAYPWEKRERCAARLIWLRAFDKPTYNPLMALQVVQILRKGFPQIHLTMIGRDKGDGSMQEVQRFIQANGLQANCQIIPGIPKSEIPHYLSKADIFLNTTNLESFGVAVMEAAALGLPVVSTNVGELPYIWTHEQNALLVPQGDAPAMAAAVERLLREPALAARLSANGRRKAEEYDLPAILPQWDALFEKITASISSHG